MKFPSNLSVRNQASESNGETKSLSYKSYLMLARGDSNFLEKQGRD